MAEDIKVLGKVFAVLEYIIAADGRAVLPSELIEKTGMTQPTCVRILRYLTENGWLAQTSRRKGYTAGPLTFWPARFPDPLAELKSAAGPTVAECARSLRCGVLLAVRHSGFRYIVCGYNASPEFTLDLVSPRFRDLFSVASGRLLLAYASERERSEIFKANPEPDYGLMPKFRTLKAFAAELDRIRKQGYDEGYFSGRGSIAFPVFRDGEFTAVIASAWLDSKSNDASKIGAVLRKAAGKITDKLSAKLITV